MQIKDIVLSHLSSAAPPPPSQTLTHTHKHTHTFMISLGHKNGVKIDSKGIEPSGLHSL